jgi:drug/metabolite transporter (DMT)-like permease
MAALPPEQVMMHRGWISVGIILAVAMMGGQRLGIFATPRLGLHAVRNAVHFAAQYAWMFAITQIPLADVFALEFTMPIWLAFLAPFVLGERMTPMRLVSVALGFLGALIVIRPAGAAMNPGSMAAISCAIGYALSVMAVKTLTRTDSALTVLAWMSVMQCIYALLFGVWRGEILSPSWETLGWCAAVALCGLGSHYCMTRAFALADTLIVAPMDYLRLPLIALIGVTYYGEPFDSYVLAGGALIAFANIVNLAAERRRR